MGKVKNARHDQAEVKVKLEESKARRVDELHSIVKVKLCSWFPSGKTWSVMVYNRITCCYYTVAYYDNKDAACREAYVLETCIKSLLDSED